LKLRCAQHKASLPCDRAAHFTRLCGRIFAVWRRLGTLPPNLLRRVAAARRTDQVAQRSRGNHQAIFEQTEPPITRERRDRPSIDGESSRSLTATQWSMSCCEAPTTMKGESP
jgi:hypothetical protein